MIRIITTIFLYFTCCFFLGVTNLNACDVPVYLYALERWYPDSYEVTILHKGELSAEEASVIDLLKKTSDQYSHTSNFTFYTADIAKGIPETIQGFWSTLSSPPLPCIVVRYPIRGAERAGFWYGPLTIDTAKLLVDSPARQEIAKRILKGNAVVWVILESGSRSDNDSVAAMFTSQLPHLGKTLVLPESFTEGISAGTLPQLSFSFVRVSRNDAKELNFIDMLINSEPGLSEFASYPIAFPVFGRGRAFPPLVGKGINERNIRRVCEFAIGECSCEVKAMNPGMDILMSVDWNFGIAQMYSPQPEVPPLVGLSTITEVSSEQKEQSEKKSQPSYSQPLSTPQNEGGQKGKGSTHQEDTTVTSLTPSDSLPLSQSSLSDSTVAVEASEKSPLLRNILIGFGIIIIAVGILSAGVLMQKRGEKR